jgi:hypothetical protein
MSKNLRLERIRLTFQLEKDIILRNIYESEKNYFFSKLIIMALIDLAFICFYIT